MFVFGPVPSRRLGKSLGINNIPSRTCSFSCVYCQLGRTSRILAERAVFHDPHEVLDRVREKAGKVRAAGDDVDYLTFVAEGEPTLDLNLGRHIELLRPLGIRTAVISNSSLIWRQDVREDLMKADWVSLKVDSVRERTWRRVDRPHGSLRLADILDGILRFSKEFGGELVTETMLVKGINDSSEQVRDTAAFLRRVKPARAYLSIPTRPPAESWAGPPGEDVINRAFQVFKTQLSEVEYLIGYEGNSFACTGNIEEDVLGITAVHPMREEAMADFLSRAHADWSAVRRLIDRDLLIETEYHGKRFYVRRINAV